MKESKNNWWLLLPILFVYVVGMFNDVMEPDAAQYAAMSMEMLDTGNYLQVYYRGEDYLDKPPLIFWASALSFRMFGISNFAYKLPSLLFMLLSLYATYRLAKALYNERIGYYGVIVLASCQAWFTMNQDVKTDNILAGCTVFAIWQLVVYVKDSRISHLLFASLGIAGAMLTKGPIGLMIPVLALATDFALKRQWKNFFQWQWLLVGSLVVLCLLPMLVGLYQQYDLHPGKMTYNGKITSGLRFYFWTQSFGRLTGESTWKNHSDPFFFVHTFLWSFLPWSVVFLIAFWKRIKEVVKSKFLLGSTQEGVTVGGIVFPFIAFSLSAYKLPHYIFVIYPLAAILVGVYLFRLLEEERYVRKLKQIKITQWIISFLLITLVMVLCVYSFPMKETAWWILVGLGLLSYAYAVIADGSRERKLLYPSIIAILLCNFMLNIHFYPSLLHFQSASVVAQRVRDDDMPLIEYQGDSFALNFYYHKDVERIDSLYELHRWSGKTVWIFTGKEGYEDMKTSRWIVETHPYPNYHITKLKGSFLNTRRRSSAITHTYLLKVSVP